MRQIHDGSVLFGTPVTREPIFRLSLRAACLGLLCLAGCGSGGRTTQPRYHNPVFARDFPDPMVLRVGPRSYYAYATSTGWERGYFPILHSTDFYHWRYVGDVFPLAHAPALGGDLWAPDVVRRAATYYVYFTDDSHCIGVASGPTPTGPFKERGTIDCVDSAGAGLIDPAVLIDTDGQAYLYASVDSPHHITVIPLRKDLVHEARRGIPLFGESQRWEGDVTVEGPFPLHVHGKYYVFYSGNSYPTPYYAMGYATGPSPLGPFHKCTCNPILAHTKGVVGPGGGSVVQGPDGKLWMAYHAWSKGADFENGARSFRLDPLVWNGRRFSITPTAG